MPTTPSAKTKSPHGSSGPGVPPETVVDSEAYQETTAMLASCESQGTPEPPILPTSGSEPVGADPVAGSGDDHAPFVPMSETDRKLATRMTRAISDQLGLSGRTRSVRV